MKMENKEKGKEGESVQPNYFKGIPEDLIENDILTFLNTKDLFFSVRGISTEWSDYMRNIWCNKIKDEMVEQVKAIDLVYEKEVFGKTYEFKIKYLLNYKNLLTLYIINTSISTVINNLRLHFETNQVNSLLKMFFLFTGLDQPLYHLENLEYDNIYEYFENRDNQASTNYLVLDLLKTDNFHRFDSDELNSFKTRFGELNKEELENLSDSSKLIYSFLLGLIEYQLLKIDIREIKSKIDKLINTIQESAKLWPRKRLFLERAYKILLFSKCTNNDLKEITNLYEKFRIRHPLIDFNDDSLKMIIDLKEKLNDPEFDPSKLEETVFDNILNRRVLLSKKILIVEKFLQIYKKAFVNENEFIIRGEKLNLIELLWCLKFSSNSEGEGVNEETVLRTKRYLDDHFDYESAIIYSCPKEKQMALLKDIDKEEEPQYEIVDNQPINIIGENRHKHKQVANTCTYEEDDLYVDNCIDEHFCHEELEEAINSNGRTIQRNLNRINERREYSDEDDEGYEAEELQRRHEYIDVKKTNTNNFADLDEEEDIDVINQRNLEEKAALNDLKKQKSELTVQKEKTEQVLVMMKKFLTLKEHVLNNKKKYKFILYVLTKVRGENMENVTFETVKSIIRDMDVNDILERPDFELSEEEINDLENFETAENLVKEIERQLFKHVDDVLNNIKQV